MQVLALLCRAHLGAGDAASAAQALDTLEVHAPGAAASDPTGHLPTLVVEAKVAAGKVADALRMLVDQMKAADLAAAPAGGAASKDALPAGGAAARPSPADAFLAGLRMALTRVSDGSLPSFQAAVSAFVWKASGAGAGEAGVAALLGLTQTLLAQEQGGPLCQQLALQALAGDDVSVALHRSPATMARVHSVLWHRAAHCLEGGDAAAAKELFAAAYHFSRPEGAAKGARALAACHSRLGMHQRAAEWLDVAARHEAQPSSVTQLGRLQEHALTGDVAQVGIGGETGGEGVEGSCARQASASGCCCSLLSMCQRATSPPRVLLSHSAGPGRHSQPGFAALRRLPPRAAAGPLPDRRSGRAPSHLQGGCGRGCAGAHPRGGSPHQPAAGAGGGSAGPAGAGAGCLPGCRDGRQGSRRRQCHAVRRAGGSGQAGGTAAQAAWLAGLCGRGWRSGAQCCRDDEAHTLRAFLLRCMRMATSNC